MTDVVKGLRQSGKLTPVQTVLLRTETPAQRRAALRKRLTTTAVSVGIHASILAGILLTLTEAPKIVEAPPITVALIDSESLFPKPTPAAPSKPTPTKPLPQRKIVRRVANNPKAVQLPATESPVDLGPGMTEAQLSGATSADAGLPGGGCDMAKRLQAALRRDAMVQSVVSRLGGRALMVWNGDWVRSHGEDGNGLSAVRESIMWEVGFAPEACRSQKVHGMILFSFTGGRLALGAGEWRWSDLVANRAAASGESAWRR